MILVKPLNRDSVLYVVEHLWSRGQREVETFGYQTDEIAPMLIACVGKPYSFAICDESGPVAITGANEVAPGCWRTWFLATDDFERQALGVTRALRRALKEGVSQQHPHSLELHSASGHPDTDRWFGLLGFVPADNQGGPIRRFVWAGC